MFNLTILLYVGSMKTVFSFPNKEILLILEDELFVERTNTFCLSGAALVPFAQLIISVNVPPGHQRDRKF